MRTRVSSISHRTTRRRLAASLAVLVALPLTLVGPAAAQDQGTTPGQGTAAVQGPPDWVTAGTRLSYKSGGATILGDGGTRLVEDPNGPITDPATGTRYREEWTAGTPQGGSGYEGVTEITVVGRSGTDVIVARSGLVKDQMSGGWIASPSSAERVAGADVSLAWRHPDLLAADTGTLGGFQVLRGQVTLGGTPYETVTLVRAQPGDYAALWFDVTTGQLLQAATRSTSQNGTTMSTLELQGVRQMTLPGIGGSVPEAIARASGLAYSGTATIVNPLDPSQPGMSTPIRTEVTFTDRGDTWTLQQASSVAQGIGTPSVNTSGTGGIGPYWWSPAALATMTAGQVLDQDPWTGFTTTVSGVGQTALGPAVAILTTGNGIQGETQWDTGTGVMLGQTIQSQVSGITSQLQLEAMP